MKIIKTKTNKYARSNIHNLIQSKKLKGQYGSHVKLFKYMKSIHSCNNFSHMFR